MFDPIFSIAFFVSVVAIMWWYTGRKPSRGHKPDEQPRGNRPIVRRDDEAHLPKWVVKARRDMEKRR